MGLALCKKQKILYILICKEFMSHWIYFQRKRKEVHNYFRLHFSFFVLFRFRLDSRKGNLNAAPHSAIASDLGQRLFFSIGETPKDSRLQIKEIKAADGGVYRCRVDFFNSPTRNYRINLTLVGKWFICLYWFNIYSATNKAQTSPD